MRHSPRPVRRVAAVVLAVVVGLGSVGGGPAAATAESASDVAPAAAATTGRAACEPTPFTAAFDAELRRRWPNQRFTASVHDRRTGCWYEYRPDRRITTASVLKAEILAGLLLRAQREGRGLTAWEHARVGPMISRSADPEASALWLSLGGVAGMRRVDADFGLTQTTPASPWGLTSTSARDRTRLMEQLLYGGGPLTASYRAIARGYLLDVVASQRWGITAGVPPGTRVPMKNGFFSSRCCRWRLNSSGAVETTGGGYVVTILSDQWPNEASGIAGVNFVSRVIAARLAGPYPPFATQGKFGDRAWADVLGRTPTYSELMAAVGTTAWDRRRAGSVLAPLYSRSEHTTVGPPVIRLYLAALGRPPDGSSYALREWQLRAGRTDLRSIARFVAESAELGLTGLDDEAFVDEAARRVLGRSATDHERTAWAERIALGWAHRGDVLLSYTESNVSRWFLHHRVTTAAVYLTMLERAPEASALAYWSGALGSGSTLAGLTNSVFLSAEYRDRVR